MKTFSLTISTKSAHRLNALASAANITSEEFLSACIEEWLSNKQGDFGEAATYTLSKNKEFYHRLESQRSKG